MSLFNKVRILVGALVHKPLMTKPEKVALDNGSESPPEGSPQVPPSALEAKQNETAASERVADLIAEQRLDEG